MNNSRSAVLASLQTADDVAVVTYRNLDGEVVPAPVPVWQPTKFKVEPTKDDFVLLASRARRRLAARAEARAQRKGKRAYVRAEMRRQETATDLAQFFNIIDGLQPARPIVRVKMRKTIAEKVKAVVDADQARYDREIAARQEDRSLPAPTPPIRREDVEKQLRGIAKTARTVGPRVRRDPDLVYPFTRAEERALTTGRTGRAG